MCGVAGWVDFERDLSAETAAVAAMVAAIEHRGPDARRVWAGADAVLASARLAIVDPANGSQPLVGCVDGWPVAVVVHNGEIYNHAALRTALRRRGHRFRTACDTEVLLAAYLEWGAACVERLEGMFAYAIWDLVAKRLVLARDRLGIKPLYVHRIGTGMLFGSEERSLLAHPLVERAIDADSLREALEIIKTPGRAFHAGIDEVKPGHVMQFGLDGVVSRAYWRLGESRHEDSFDVAAANVRDHLTRSVRAQASCEGALGALVSGGLDSSLVAALASAANGNARLAAYSIDHEAHQLRFAAEGEWHDADAPYARLVAAQLHADHVELLVTARELVDSASREAVVRALDAPLARGDVDVCRHLLCVAAKHRGDVVLAGDGADELFAGYYWLHRPGDGAPATFPWFGGDDIARGRLLHPDLRTQLERDAYRADAYRDAIAAAPIGAAACPAERAFKQAHFLHLTRLLRSFLDRMDRIGMGVGLEVRVPYCDHRLVEYAWAMPWRHLTSVARPKAILRAAATGILPPAVLDRPKSGFPATTEPAYASALQSRVRAILNDPASPVTPYVDRAAVAAAVAPALRGRSRPADRAGLEFVLDFNAWLLAGPVDVRL